MYFAKTFKVHYIRLLTAVTNILMHLFHYLIVWELQFFNWIHLFDCVSEFLFNWVFHLEDMV